MVQCTHHILGKRRSCILNLPDKVLCAGIRENPDFLPDPASRNAVPIFLKEMRKVMELDKPIFIQYLSFLTHLVHGDWGRSFYNQQPVLTQLLDVLPNTIELVISGILIGILIGVPPGLLAAVKPNSLFDHVVRIGTLIGISIPIFVMGIFLISIFSLKLDLLPAIGMSRSEGLGGHLAHLILPAFSCGLMMMASIARLIRAAMLDVLNRDYILTARAKGVIECLVICKHGLRNALLPLITYLGIYVNILLGSAVLVEVIFTRPGVGRVIVEAIKSNDFPIVQTTIMLYAGAVVLVNLFIDIIYCFVDPRIAYR